MCGDMSKARSPMLYRLKRLARRRAKPTNEDSKDETMTTNSQPASVKIYTFPARGRFALGDNHEEAKPASNATLPRFAKLVVGGAWYHEAAIQEERS
jgi:hypothetical protein